MIEKKTKLNKLNPNFAYAIIAILSVGLLLYTAIEVSNCKSDIKQINQDIQKLTKKVENNIDGKNNKFNKNDVNGINQKLTNIDDTKNLDIDKLSSKEIIYNEDGSIDISNWETYINKNLGFSVKYPNFWKVNELEKSVEFYDYREQENYFRNRKDFFIVSRTKKLEKISGNAEYIPTSIMDMITKEFEINFVQKTLLNFHNAFEVTIGGMGLNFAILTKVNEYFYQIYFESDHKTDVYEMIIRSFKFL